MDKNKYIEAIASSIKSNNNSLRKAKGFPSFTNIWNNSVYSFNKNFLKNLPAVDNVVNKLIKSFFTINALANNPKGKKSKLVQRRYFRLSLNKILVSKSEIKHSNDKVFITVYLFNKKKRSMLLSLKTLYNSFLDTSPKRNFNNTLETNLVNMENRKLGDDLSIQSTNNNKNSSAKVLASVTLSNKPKNKAIINNLLVNKYSFIGLLVKGSTTEASLNTTSNNEYYEYFQKNFNRFIQYASKKRYQIYNNRFALKYKILTGVLALKNTSTNKALINASSYLNMKGAKKNILPIRSKFGSSSKESAYNNVLYYNKLNNLTKYNIQKYITSRNSILNANILKDSSKYVNKYKLYNNISNKDNLELVSLNNKPNYSIYKLRSISKLFAIYNNVNILNKDKLNNEYSNKILLNTYKLLKKSNNLDSNLVETKSKKALKNTVLVNKFNRIDKFFDKYNDVLKSNNLYMNNIGLVTSTYKINFISELLEKELLYVSYLKLLSYNQAIFKNWFTYSLRNLISKIYNKKVVLNLVNLKYIHLNSDILTQAVNIRLRNFKKNRVVKVLKKIIKLVPISKINIYACDEHSPIYKYVKDHNNRFSSLKLDIFKDLGIVKSDTNVQVSNENNEVSVFKPHASTKIRRLNHMQASTINFIKYKSVFGVRFEAAGRLTKRSTASRSLFKFKYKGSLRNNPSVILNNSDTAVRLKNNRISNLQFTKIASKTRNGSFGLKGWINNN